MPFRVIMQSDGFDLLHDDKCILSHRAGAPSIRIGIGSPDLEMVRGNFRIDDIVETRLKLDCFAQDDGCIRLWNAKQTDVVATLQLEEKAQQSILKFRCSDPASTGFG